MRVMSIDIGTNSTLHLVVDIANDYLKIVERGLVGNMLGMGQRRDNSLSPSTIASNEQILQNLMVKAKQLGCQRIGAVGTHALRSAVNSADFIKMSDSIGLKLNIISSQLEAELAWIGIFGLEGSLRKRAVLDIGGGSSELSIGSGIKPNWSSSVPVAAVNTTGSYFHHDPPTISEIERAKEHIEKSFDVWKGKVDYNCPVIGIAGATTSIVAIQNKVTNYFPGTIENASISLDQIRMWKDLLFRKTKAERAVIIGMPAARAGNIHAGALILYHVLTLLSVNEITVSERGVLFGLAYKLVENEIE